MRPPTLRSLLHAIALLFGSPALADDGWHIARFDTRLDVDAGGTVTVTEKIYALFDVPKHGIYREIPVRYDVGHHLYDLRFRLLDVDDGEGNPLKTKVDYEGNKVRIRIGDPKRTITGAMGYRIRYRVERAVLHEGDHAVLRWNATGTEWRVPIDEATVTVALPGSFPEGEINADAWTGFYGSKGKDYTAERPDDRTLVYHTGPLRPSEGITVDVAMPADAVAEPGWLTQLGWWMGDNFVYFLIPITLAGCAGLWYRKGRDHPGMGSIVVQYEPPDELGPAEVGTLIDERVDMRDVSAVVIDLAVRGYLKITEIETGAWIFKGKDYRLEKLKTADGLKGYERRMFEKIFYVDDTVLLSDLREKFYNVLPKVKSDLYGQLASMGYFDGKPDAVRTGYCVGGLFTLLAALGVCALLQYWWVGRVFPVAFIVTGLLCALVVIATAMVMPRKTRKGRIAWEKIAGLEEFIRRAEVDDLKAKDRQGVFERLLPYAIAFKLTDRWAKAFEGLYQTPPNWYRPAGNGPFNTLLLVNSIDNSVGALNSTLPSQPRSTGSSGSSGWSSGGFSGGSSGGGFGGGGGGSW